MCGIVGYVGSKSAQERILHGLSQLEYRGYDSAGVSILSDGVIQTTKRVGKLAVLEEALCAEPLSGHIGIGHTRWATHGAPSNMNAHPHLNESKTIAVVHNGIIENYLELKEFLLGEGYHFVSETDTEVIAHLLDYYHEGSPKETLQKVISRLEGAYALAILFADAPETLFGARHESPLVLGHGDGEFFLASDIPALLQYTRRVSYLEDGDLVALTKDGVEIFDVDAKPLTREEQIVEWDQESATKEGYPHFMIKEIHEQPRAITTALSRKCAGGELSLGQDTFDANTCREFTNIVITACGTAYHAGEVGRRAIEMLAHRPVMSEIASELKSYHPFIDDKTLLIAVSQSGETSDTLSAVRKAKAKGAKILAITNVVGSSLSREADRVIYCDAGPEISVASTKAYTTQLVALYAFALDFAQKLGTLTEEETRSWVKKLLELPEKLALLLEENSVYKELAERIKDEHSMFFLGRGLDYLSAKEGALKLKEISYINAVAFPSGELKHGSIALIEEGTPVVSLLTQEELLEKSISNIKEVTARGAFAIAMTTLDAPSLKDVADVVIQLPAVDDLLAPVVASIPQQLLAYETSVCVGNDVDKPRNLAKSVTVE